MHERNASPARTIAKVACVAALTLFTAFITDRQGFDQPQIISSTVFVLIIGAAMFFYDFHLPIAFVGIALLLLFGVMDLPRLIAVSHLDVILFLVGMMVMVGILKELGLFSWIIISVISMPSLTARRFVLISCVVGAAMSCMVDEMTAIVFIAALIFQVCDTMNLKPVPFVIMAVMAINIGSAGTMLGNPVGILIGQSAVPPLSFNDFMTWSFPLMAAEFVVVLVFMFWHFRREIGEMEDELRKRRESGLTLGPLVEVPHRLALLILFLLMLLLSLHTMLEIRLGLARNTLLIMTPLLMSGLLMLWRRESIRDYMEKEVEWVTLVFFMMLFVVAGTLEYTRVTDRIADGFVTAFEGRPDILLPVILGISAVGSAFVENIVFVAAFMPVVARLEDTPLLWALLHGACLGGNITMIGSTANIAAVGLLERRYWTLMNFYTWLRTGIMVGLLSCLVAWGGLALMSPYMPTPEERMREAGMLVDAALGEAHPAP